MMSDDRIDEVFNLHHIASDSPWANWRRFARAVEQESAAPLLDQIGRLQGEIGLALAKIKDDDAMLRTALHALRDLLDDTQHSDHKDCDDGPCPVREARVSMDSIRQRLEV